MTDSERNLALARMMGLRVGRPGPHGECMLYQPSKTAAESLDDCLAYDPLSTVSSYEDHMPFDPVHDGADFDAVLMWALNGGGMMWNAISLCFARSNAAQSDTEFRRAVCQAIVEVQREGDR